jgi:conjugative relaxase-like TrwC/TraI family protein
MADGTTVKPVEHRAGWDATFSAPKSVSLTALVGGDDRICSSTFHAGRLVQRGSGLEQKQQSRSLPLQAEWQMGDLQARH